MLAIFNPCRCHQQATCMTPAGNPRSMNATISHHPSNQPFPGKWLWHYHIILSETTINHFSPPKKRSMIYLLFLVGFDIAIFFGSLNTYDHIWSTYVYIYNNNNNKNKYYILFYYILLYYIILHYIILYYIIL